MNDARLPTRARKLLLTLNFPDGPDRLVRSPVFLYSPIRSGSTLLRVILDSHSKICAPHELHLNRVRVGDADSLLSKSMKALGLTTSDLEDLLWDRIMHRQLVLTRKPIFVDKTPQNVGSWERIAHAWPHARYIFLLRHPVSIIQSWQKITPDKSDAFRQRRVLWYAHHINAARDKLDGVTVRYEDLTARPEEVTRQICSSLGVRWEAGMLDYGKSSHGEFKKGIGDISDNLKSGKIQPPRPLPQPHEVPEALRRVAEAWGY